MTRPVVKRQPRESFKESCSGFSPFSILSGKCDQSAVILFWVKLELFSWGRDCQAYLLEMPASCGVWAFVPTACVVLYVSSCCAAYRYLLVLDIRECGSVAACQQVSHVSLSTWLVLCIVCPCTTRVVLKPGWFSTPALATQFFVGIVSGHAQNANCFYLNSNTLALVKCPANVFHLFAVLRIPVLKSAQM